MEEGLGLGLIFRLFKYLVLDILYQLLACGVGWFFLRIITLGKYPEQSLSESLKEDATVGNYTGLMGFIVIAAISTYYLYTT